MGAVAGLVGRDADAESGRAVLHKSQPLALRHTLRIKQREMHNAVGVVLLGHAPGSGHVARERTRAGIGGHAAHLAHQLHGAGRGYATGPAVACFHQKALAGFNHAQGVARRLRHWQGVIGGAAIGQREVGMVALATTRHQGKTPHTRVPAAESGYYHGVLGIPNLATYHNASAINIDGFAGHHGGQPLYHIATFREKLHIGPAGRGPARTPLPAGHQGSSLRSKLLRTDGRRGPDAQTAAVHEVVARVAHPVGVGAQHVGAGRQRIGNVEVTAGPAALQAQRAARHYFLLGRKQVDMQHLAERVELVLAGVHHVGAEPNGFAGGVHRAVEVQVGLFAPGRRVVFRHLPRNALQRGFLQRLWSKGH